MKADDMRTERPLHAQIHEQTRIGHVHLKVADLKRALGFYRDVLGFADRTAQGDMIRAMLPLLALALLSIQSPATNAAGAGHGSTQARLQARDATPAVDQNADQQPDPTMPPEGNTKALAVYGKGVQIYRCAASSDGSAQWVFVAPEADLFRNADMTGTAQGTHGAGPVWRWDDGSALAGTLVAKKAAPASGAIPWLLLSTMPTADSGAGGQLQKFTFVRRTDTQGGVAPASGCTVPASGQLLKVPYTATYIFYVGR